MTSWNNNKNKILQEQTKQCTKSNLNGTFIFGIKGMEEKIKMQASLNIKILQKKN